MDYRSNKLKSSKSKGVIIFTGVTLALSIGGIVGFIFLNENPVLKGFMIIMFAVFAVVAFIILYDQLFDYVMIKDDYIVYRLFLVKKATKIKNISKIILEKGSYDLYVKNKKFFTISKYDKVTPAMMNQIEKHGFDLSKIISKDYSE